MGHNKDLLINILHDIPECKTNLPKIITNVHYSKKIKSNYSYQKLFNNLTKKFTPMCVKMGIQIEDLIQDTSYDVLTKGAIFPTYKAAYKYYCTQIRFRIKNILRTKSRTHDVQYMRDEDLPNNYIITEIEAMHPGEDLFDGNFINFDK